MTTKKTQTNTQQSLEKGTVSITGMAIPFDAPETTVLSQDGAGNGKRNLAAALAKAQSECQNVTMNKINPHFRSKYADLAAVRDCIIPIFSKHGLSIVQAPTMDGMGFYLETRLMHSSGEELTWSFPLPTDVNKPQVIGSAISYARRYTLSAIAAIASEEDDDGNAAQNPNGGGGRGPNAGPANSSHSVPSEGIVL